MPVVYERLISLDAADHHARIVNCECLAIRRYHTMNMADDLAIFLEIKVPRVRIDLLGVGRVPGTTRALLHVLAVAVLRTERHLLAVRARHLLFQRVDTVGLGVNTAPGLQLLARAER